MRRFRLRQEHTGHRHAGQGAGPQKANHLRSLRAGGARGTRAHRRGAGACPAGRPITGRGEQPGGFPQPERRAARYFCRQPGRQGARAYPGAACRALFHLRRERCDPHGYDFPARCTRALRDLPGYGLPARSLGGASERLLAARGLRPDDRPGL